MFITPTARYCAGLTGPEFEIGYTFSLFKGSPNTSYDLYLTTDRTTPEAPVPSSVEKTDANGNVITDVELLRVVPLQLSSSTATLIAVLHNAPTTAVQGSATFALGIALRCP